MSRQERFTFLCNQNERLMIANLADWLQRTQSDAVRFVIRQTVRSIDMGSKDNIKELQKEVQHDK